MEPLPDGNFLQWLSTLGIGGVLAGMMFYFYRKDVKQYTELWRGQSDALMTVVKENTKAITENTAVVQSLHSHMDLNDRRREERG